MHLTALPPPPSPFFLLLPSITSLSCVLLYVCTCICCMTSYLAVHASSLWLNEQIGLSHFLYSPPASSLLSFHTVSMALLCTVLHTRQLWVVCRRRQSVHFSLSLPLSHPIAVRRHCALSPFNRHTMSHYIAAL